MKNALILHGIGNNSRNNWFPWLKTQLERRGYEVWVPDLPNFDKPDLGQTYNFVKDRPFGPNTLLIGHSSGAAIVLGILQKLPAGIIVKRAILVAGFISAELKPELFKYVSKSDYKNHFPKKWDWEKIKRSAKDFIIFYSSSDPYVPVEQAETIQKNLSSKLINIPDAKHFSISSTGERFRKFPELLNYVP